MIAMTPSRIGLVGTLILCAGWAAADTPIGLDAMEQFGRLPELRQGVRTYQFSSHAPDGGNYDTGHFLEILGDEKVLLDVKGAGCIYRIWMTGIDLNALIRIYFDGSSVPTVEMPLGEFFSGRVAPFLLPLVCDDNHSSGGFVCYLPIPFEQGCRLTTTSFGHYYNVTYQRFADATGVTTFTGNEDSSVVRAMWENHGSDPKTDQGTIELNGTTTVPAGGSLTLADISEPGSIQQLELILPGMETPSIEAVWDDGRAHTDYSEFTVAVDPANAGVQLTPSPPARAPSLSASSSSAPPSTGTSSTTGWTASWAVSPFAPTSWTSRTRSTRRITATSSSGRPGKARAPSTTWATTWPPTTAAPRWTGSSSTWRSIRTTSASI